MEVMKTSSWGNGKISIKNLPEGEYIDLRTGEIKQCKSIDNRSQNIHSLKKTFTMIRDLVNSNTTELERVRFVTVTYKENMKDSSRLYEDLKKFRKKVKYHFGKFEYISVAEPQGRGAWHTHEIWIFPGKAPFLKQDWLESELWQKGSVRVAKIDDNDNLGAYLTAYLGDIALDDLLDNGLKLEGEITSKEFVDHNGKEQIKKYVKGGRLQLYPPKFNIYRCSRGIKQPIIEKQSYFEAQKKIGSLKPTFKKAFEITDDSTGFKRSISYDYYNTKRKNNK